MYPMAAVGMRYFITGTGTDVGKTFVASKLIAAANREGIPTVGFKPISCGGLEDVVALRDAGPIDGPDLDLINPVVYATPAAPYTAAMFENKPFELQPILDAYAELSAKYEGILVEGAGGWEVPITRDYRVGDLAKEIGLPVIVVVNNRLGALNETILTVEAIRRRGLECAGLILNHLEDERDMPSVTNESALEDILEVPILLDVLHGVDELDLPWQLTE